MGIQLPQTISINNTLNKPDFEMSSFTEQASYFLG